jgi:predicted RNA-binding protein with PIN domain
VPVVRAGGRGGRADRPLRPDLGGVALTILDELLRPAIELAFLTAVAGSKQRPPLETPPAILPYLRFQKLPAAALVAVRRAVEQDDAFRKRLASVATEEIVGRPGWLWLHRPESWEAELERLVQEEVHDEEDRAERKATKRLAAAEEKVRRLTSDVHGARAELAVERARRQEAEAAGAKVERRAAQLEIELRGARRKLADADERVARATALEHEARLSVDQAFGEAAALRARVEELEQQPAAAPAAPAATPADERPALAPPGALDVAGIAAALREAAEAGRRLAAALEAAGAAAGPAGGEPGIDDPGRWAAPPGRVRPPRARARRRARRLPLPIPGGLYGDSVEAAAHLLRAPGVLLVVDGYNVAKLGWPECELADQRRRLLDALDELTLRHGTRVHVVFDGAEVTPLPTGRRNLRVEFSPAGTTADEVIVELVAALPAEQPVVVATNDGEVRDGARRQGANVIASQQLLAVAKRG